MTYDFHQRPPGADLADASTKAPALAQSDECSD